MKFIPREMSWFKRRKPTESDKKDDINRVEVLNFKKIHNHECLMTVYYKCTDVKVSGVLQLTARVHENNLANPTRWTVQGINSQGISVVVDVVE